MSYTNPTGYFNIQDPSLEPPDCWCLGPGEPEDEEYDRGEDELIGRFNRG